MVTGKEISHRPAWTQLAGTAVYNASYAAHEDLQSRLYHNWGMVCGTYRAIHDALKYPYDRALDLAVLSRTAVLDLSKKRDETAIRWLADKVGEDDPDLPGARRLLASCITYDLSEDPRLVLASLGHLCHPQDVIGDIALIREEAYRYYRLDDVSFYSSFDDSLSRLNARLRDQEHGDLDPNERDTLQNIRKGIARIRLDLRDSFDSMEAA